MKYGIIRGTLAVLTAPILLSSLSLMCCMPRACADGGIKIELTPSSRESTIPPRGSGESQSQYLVRVVEAIKAGKPLGDVIEALHDAFSSGDSLSKGALEKAHTSVTGGPGGGTYIQQCFDSILGKADPIGVFAFLSDGSWVFVRDGQDEIGVGFQKSAIKEKDPEGKEKEGSAYSFPDGSLITVFEDEIKIVKIGSGSKQPDPEEANKLPTAKDIVNQPLGEDPIGPEEQRERDKTQAEAAKQIMEFEEQRAKEAKASQEEERRRTGRDGLEAGARRELAVYRNTVRSILDLYRKGKISRTQMERLIANAKSTAESHWGGKVKISETTRSLQDEYRRTIERLHLQHSQGKIDDATYKAKLREAKLAFANPLR